MTKIKHPSNKYDRIVSEQKKTARKARKQEREGRVQAKLAKELLKIQETEDDLRSVLVE
jgi:hypothetical protein